MPTLGFTPADFEVFQVQGFNQRMAQIYEHVRPNNPRTLARWQRLDNWNIWPRLAGGCHPTRDTEAAIRAAGFIVEQSRRFAFKAGPVTAPHILGVARRP